MTGFWQDLRLALRSVRKQPGFTLTAAITLEGQFEHAHFKTARAIS